MVSIDQKIKYWQNKLIDLGRSSKLINAPKKAIGSISKTSIEFLKPDIYTLWELLSEGKKPLEIPVRVEEIYDEKEDKKESAERQKQPEKANFVFSNGVSTNQSEKDTIHTLKNLKNKARIFLEEKGFNALYMAFGFLHWKGNSHDNKKMRSPLILVPVEITQENFFSNIFISRHDDEIISNNALAQKFLNDFKISLPVYHGEDTGLAHYFELVRAACHNFNAEIELSAELSLFSFLKINMYQDLGAHKNEIASHLIVNIIAGNTKASEKNKLDLSEFDYDNTSPKEILSVVDADSSQQDAINLAKRGVSFVLQGPPGTGKSQTITNIIAELLAMGKTVLFVSEKMAALDVVYKRLSSVGLKDFCLTLHSHNAKRREILNQLEASLKLAQQRAFVAGEAAQKLNRLVTVRQNLNEYIKELHTYVEPLHITMYQANGILASLDKSPNIIFTVSGANKVTQYTYTEMLNTLGELAKIIEDKGWQTDNPWNDCNVKAVTYDFRLKFSEECPRLVDLLNEGSDLIKKFNRNIEISSAYNCDALEEIPQFLAVALDEAEVPSAWICEDIYKLSKLCEDWKQKSDNVANYFNNSVYTLDLEGILRDLKLKHRSIFRVFNKNYKELRFLLASHTKKGRFLSYNEAITRVEQALSAKTAQIELESAIDKVSDDDYQLPDYRVLKSAIDKAHALYEFAKKHNVPQTTLEKLAYRDTALIWDLEDIYKCFKDWHPKFIPAVKEFAKLFNNPENITGMEFFELYNKVASCCNNFSALEAYVDYNAILKKCKVWGIDLFIIQAAKAKINAAEIVPAFKKCFFRSWMDQVIDSFKYIKSFRRLKHEEMIKEFKELDTAHMEISRAAVIARLVEKLPNLDAFTAGHDELGLLKREIAKQRKLLPPRKLIAMIPNLLLILKPCLMMSPLSVSTFLSDNIKFDTVIFDEASQIRTEDAIGAIFRAKQAIIAGDSKQLPPTDFFMTSAESADYEEDDDSSEYDDTGAYQSLLDEALLLPSKTLRWHYRSKHEHLIAFSNSKIYSSSLVTFPSSVESDPYMGVQYIYVPDGVYDRGGRRGNRKEAERVADLVFEHFKTTPERSLGVIAFGEVQQQAISDALDLRRRNNKGFEQFFNENKPEPFFIKNLETVQGDERDSIIFSIGYAKDPAGKFTMNFGPLSRAGGERRLNVAITRARYNIKLVGSILPTDINIDRVGFEGPKLLKLYIEFAMNGPKSLSGEVKLSDKITHQSDFEKAVYDYLTECGYDVATQVGCSGYRIDLAVHHPTYKGRFVLGIECDGAAYHSARTARERDRLRQSVLETMGWQIYRIWSTDWVKDPVNEKARLIEAIEKAIKNYSQTPIAQHKDETATQPTTYIQTTKKPRNNLPLPPHRGCSADQVPPKEYMRIMCQILENSFGLTKEGLYKAVATSYGWQRRGAIINSCLNNVFNKLCKERIFALNGEKVELINKNWKTVI